MIVALSFDDFSILNNRFDLLDQLKEHYPDMKVSMFTIPYDYKAEMSTMRVYRDEQLQKLKERLDWIQIIPHGMTHIEKEFANCDKHTMDMYIENVHDIFDRDGLPFVHGFKAPYWLWNKNVIESLDNAGWFGAIDRNQPKMLRTKKTYTYTHSINEPFWKDTAETICLHGHIDGMSENDLEKCFLNLMKIPADAQWHFVTDFIKERT